MSKKIIESYKLKKKIIVNIFTMIKYHYLIYHLKVQISKI